MSEAAATRMDQALADAAAGDALAFAALVRAHQGMVFSLAYHFLHDRPLAEDLAWVARIVACMRPGMSESERDSNSY